MRFLAEIVDDILDLDWDRCGALNPIDPPHLKSSAENRAVDAVQAEDYG